MGKVLIAIVGVGALGVFWKELPALKRYLKIERM